MSICLWSFRDVWKFVGTRSVWAIIECRFFLFCFLVLRSVWCYIWHHASWCTVLLFFLSFPSFLHLSHFFYLQRSYVSSCSRVSDSVDWGLDEYDSCVQRVVLIGTRARWGYSGQLETEERIWRAWFKKWYLKLWWKKSSGGFVVSPFVRRRKRHADLISFFNVCDICFLLAIRTAVRLIIII